jgi:hypothetical protein
MKPITTLIIVMFSSFLGFSQSFSIQKLGTEYSEIQVNSAMQNADLCGGYFYSKPNVLIFNDGTEVVLKSKQQMLSEGLTINESCFISDSDIYHKSIWSIAEGNHLLKGFQSELYGTPKEYQKSLRIN